jgi:hypothetical protein
MSDKPISPLRQRMIDDMTARRVSEKVQKALQGGFLTAGALQINSGGTLNQSDGSASITANAVNAGTLTITGGTFSTGADFIIDYVGPTSSFTCALAQQEETGLSLKIELVCGRPRALRRRGRPSPRRSLRSGARVSEGPGLAGSRNAKGRT